MTATPTIIYVAARNGGYEGHSLPSMAFWNKREAFAWCDGQEGQWDVAEVPIHPAIQSKPWFMIDPVDRE